MLIVTALVLLSSVTLFSGPLTSADAPFGVDCGTETIETGVWSKGAVLLDGTGCTAVGVVTEIVTTVLGRIISSSVEIVEAAMFSFNGLCVGILVTSVSLAYLLALLAMIWSLSSVSKPSLLKTRAGFGTVLETVDVVPALGVVCMFVSES